MNQVTRWDPFENLFKDFRGLVLQPVDLGLVIAHDLQRDRLVEPEMRAAVQRRVLLAEAYRESEEARGDGDAQAASIYAKAYGFPS